MPNLRTYFPLCLLLFGLIFLLAACNGAGSSEQTIVMEAMRFRPGEIKVRMGQPVILHIINKDGYGHSFDVDALAVHQPQAASETLDVTFTPDTVGRYPIYCGSPGHREAGMVGMLIVAP